MRRLTPLGLALLLLILASTLTSAAVDLNYFTATWTDSGVRLDFETGSEIDHAAFNIYRSTVNIPISPDGQANLAGATKLNAQAIRNPQGTCLPTGYTYQYIDSTVPSSPDTFYYYLASISCDGLSVHVYGDGYSGLAVTRPGQPTPTQAPATPTTAPATATTVPPTATTEPSATATLPAAVTVTPQPTQTAQPTATRATSSPTATLRPGQPTATRAPNPPTVTPLPGQPSVTPRPAQPTATLRPGQPTPAPAPPTAAGGSSAGSTPPPSAPPGGTQPTFALPPGSASETGPIAVGPGATVTPGSIALGPNDPAEPLQPGPLSNSSAVTLVTPSPVAVAPALGSNPVTDPTLVASERVSDPIDWMIQGIIGLIVIAIIATTTLLGITYMRNR